MTDKKSIDISFDRLPNKEAEKHFNPKSLITSAEFANFKAYQHALAFTVAGIADKDMLIEIHKAVKSAIDNGASFNEFKKSLKPFLISKGWLAPELTGDKGVDKTLLKDYEDVLNRRLKTIYHTNKQTAYAAGKWERIQKTKDFLPFLQYLPSASVNKRDGHKAYYGIIRPVDDPIWQSIFPPNGFGCFLGDVQIQGDLQSAMVKWYEGVAVHFTTKSGRSLAITANHPILTARGWVRADGLTTSDDVLCYGLPIDVVNADGLSGQIHHNQTIPTAKNLFKAFFDQTFAFTGTTAFKFNSDVANGEIHIDVVNDGLVCHIWADVLQGVKQVKLIRGDDGRFVATGKSNSSSCFATVISDFIGSQNTSDIATTAIKTLCQSTLAYFGCGVQMNDFSFQFVITRTTDRPSLSTLPFNTTSRLFDVLPTSHTGTAHISQDDTILTELASNTCTTDFGLFGYLVDAHSSLVFADPVINIRQFSFSGHCYDFQSSESIVSANGIIAHNCKCSVKQITKSKARELGITDDDRIAELPIPDFDSNFDRLGALLRLAEDKHGVEFAEKLGIDLTDKMLELSVKMGSVSVADFTHVAVTQSEVERLLFDPANGDEILSEAMAGAEYQAYYKVRLERPTPEFDANGKPKAGFDYWITDTGQKLDFLFTMYGEKPIRIEKYNQFFAHTDDAWKGKIATIQHHFEKADIVPMDLRYITDVKNRVKLISYVLSLPKEQQKQVVFIWGEPK